MKRIFSNGAVCKPGRALFAALIMVWGTGAAEVATAESAVKLVYHPRQVDPNVDGSPRYVVDDPAADGGTAQAAGPGRSREAGSQICSLYSYARPAGLYRTTWRAKVDDNTIGDVVLSMATAGSVLRVKGTDFAAANKYQEFSYTAEKDEGGFFSVLATWGGKGTVLVDEIRVESERLFSDEELVKRAGGLDLPDAWPIPPPTPPRIHIGKGLWWDFFGFRAAVAEMGGAVVTSSFHSQGQGGSALHQFPATWLGMAAHNVIVLANVDARALGPQGRVLLKNYVENGGGLLVTGGYFAFDRGDYRHTALEEILPCSMVADDRRHDDGGLLMKPSEGSGDILPADLAWTLQPRVFYYSAVKPLPDARVLVTAGDQPLLIVRAFGRGRVAVLAASAEGDPGADQVAFWEWGDMPRLTAATLQWLMAAPRETKTFTLDEATRQRLGQLMVPGSDETDEKREREFAALLPRCRDKVFAKELIEALGAAEGAVDRNLVVAACEAARPYVDASFAAHAGELMASGNPSLVDLGLRVTGMCRAPGAVAQATRFLKEGLGAMASGDGVMSILDGSSTATGESDPGSEERVKLAAVTALGDLGDPACLAELRSATRAFSTRRQGMTEILDQADLSENVYQQSIIARARLGEKEAAAPLLDVLISNDETIRQFQNALDVMLVNPDDKNLMRLREIGRVRLPILRRRQQLCLERLQLLPTAVCVEFVKTVLERNDSSLTAYAMSALSAVRGPERSGEAMRSLVPLLNRTSAPEVLILACSRVRELKDAALAARVSTLLAELAGAPDATAARVALMRAPQLPQGERARVIAAGAAHPDAAIRRLARLSLPLLAESERAGIKIK